MSNLPEWKSPFDLTEIEAAAGFIYRIVHKATGRAYIGRKYLTTTVKRKTKPSRWRSYWGSSRHLNSHLKADGYDAFEREIISLHATREEVDYAEIETQFRHDVLRSKLPDGTPAYFNLAIPGRWFRAKTN